MLINELYQNNCTAAKSKLKHRNAFVLLSVCFVLLSNSVIYTLAVFILFNGLILTNTNTSAKKLLKLLCIPIVFIALSGIAIALQLNSGRVLIEFSSFYIGYSSASLLQAALVCCKSISVSCIFFFYMMCTSISEIATSMRYIKIPSLFIELFILTYKNIFCVLNRSNQLMIAQKSRMAYCKPKGSYRSVSFWLSSLLVGSIHEASVAHNGLQSRAYNNQFCFVAAEVQTSSKLPMIFISLTGAQALALIFFTF